MKIIFIIFVKMLNAPHFKRHAPKISIEQMNTNHYTKPQKISRCFVLPQQR